MDTHANKKENIIDNAEQVIENDVLNENSFKENQLEEKEETNTLDYVFRTHKRKSPDSIIKRLNDKNLPYKIRLGSECTEIIFYDRLMVYTSTKNFPQKKLFLFVHVLKDVKKFIANFGPVTLPVERFSTRYNLEYKYSQSVGFDINHAYWRIAYIKGIISERTYNHGLDKDCKAIRLAALSILGREKKFIDVNVENPKVYITQHFNKNLNDVFKYIRLVCFDMMNSLAKKLGDEFDCWRTDCIYFNDTPENRQIVKDYFEQKQMTFKVLDYFE